MANVIDGRAYAAELTESVRRELRTLAGSPVGIATVLVGDDYAAAVYQDRIDAGARKVGMASRPVRLPADASLGQVVGKLRPLDPGGRVPDARPVHDLGRTGSGARL